MSMSSEYDDIRYWICDCTWCFDVIIYSDNPDIQMYMYMQIKKKHNKLVQCYTNVYWDMFHYLIKVIYICTCIPGPYYYYFWSRHEIEWSTKSSRFFKKLHLNYLFSSVFLSNLRPLVYRASSIRYTVQLIPRRMTLKEFIIRTFW